MKKYYSEAISKGEIKSLFNLGSYYYDIEQDYDKTIKYYLEYISNNN